MCRIPISASIRAVLVLFLVSLITGCNSNSSSTEAAEEETLSAITVAPADRTIDTGDSLQFSAEGTCSDGSTKNLSSSLLWSSSDTRVATVTSDGMATAFSVGTAVITATAGTISGSTSLTVVMPALPVPSAPSGVQARAGDGRVTLRWDSVQGASSYNVYWSNVSGVTKSTGTCITDTISPFVHSGLANGTPCFYVVTALNSTGESTESSVVTATPVAEDTPPATSAVIIDHTCTRLDSIPSQWIESAKASLHIAYGHTSHGSQITTGMAGLVSFKGDLYTYSWGGSNDALDLRDRPFNGASDLGSPNRTAWAGVTRTYLDAHPEINVVIWSWCGQVSYATEGDIETYLDLMTGLEVDYPGVMFVYMTGHLEGTGLAGNLHLRNEQIRAYCREYDKVLYDFADIETYDPDGNSYAGRHPTDGCNYDYNNDGVTSESGDPAQPFNGDRNWAVDWQNAHTEGVDWYDCESAHSPPLNANLKAYAAWWLWARLAGWSGQ